MAKAKFLNGLFAAHKPAGVSSASITNHIKEVIIQGLKQQGEVKVSGGNNPTTTIKVGHGGTLDLNASGVLVLGIGRGTKALGPYLKGQKKYKAVGLLGKATDTHSEDGNLTVELPYDHVTKDKMLDVLMNFRGIVKQVPPIYSSLKFKGHTMASLAAAGFPVEAKPARMVSVYNIHCTSFKPPTFSFEIACSGGFYVRKLIHDIGKELGTCACMKSLERTQQGPFHLRKNVLEERDWTFPKILEALKDNKELNLKDNRKEEVRL
ncbi:pseudouridylate synthase TRUB1-like [Apostichopus japonicus]|uniref:pseudouridylate synthase TRUB1-like n=1 Tax=Stichopus japonicus TaxID=307972 RepID=UPI003AB535EF